MANDVSLERALDSSDVGSSRSRTIARSTNTGTSWWARARKYVSGVVGGAIISAAGPVSAEDPSDHVPPESPDGSGRVGVLDPRDEFCIDSSAFPAWYGGLLARARQEGVNDVGLNRISELMPQILATNAALHGASYRAMGIRVEGRDDHSLDERRSHIAFIASGIGNSPSGCAADQPGEVCDVWTPEFDQTPDRTLADRLVSVGTVRPHNLRNMNYVGMDWFNVFTELGVRNLSDAADIYRANIPEDHGTPSNDQLLFAVRATSDVGGNRQFLASADYVLQQGERIIDMYVVGPAAQQRGNRLVFPPVSDSQGRPIDNTDAPDSTVDAVIRYTRDNGATEDVAVTLHHVLLNDMGGRGVNGDERLARPLRIPFANLVRLDCTPDPEPQTCPPQQPCPDQEPCPSCPPQEEYECPSCPPVEPCPDREPCPSCPPQVPPDRVVVQGIDVNVNSRPSLYFAFNQGGEPVPQRTQARRGFRFIEFGPAYRFTLDMSDEASPSDEHIIELDDEGNQIYHGAGAQLRLGFDLGDSLQLAIGAQYLHSIISDLPGQTEQVWDANLDDPEGLVGIEQYTLEQSVDSWNATLDLQIRLSDHAYLVIGGGFGADHYANQHTGVVLEQCGDDGCFSPQHLSDGDVDVTSVFNGQGRIGVWIPIDRTALSIVAYAGGNTADQVYGGLQLGIGPQTRDQRLTFDFDEE